MKECILHGDGSSHAPYWLQGFRNEEHTQLNKIIAIAEREGITKIKYLYSGRYLEARETHWWLTSNSDTCDKLNGLPPEGRNLYERIQTKHNPT